MTDVADNFNRADDATGLGANWINSPYSPPTLHPIVSGNQASSNANNWVPAYWSNSVNTFANDQYAQATLKAGVNFGLVVRHQTTGVASYYACLLVVGTIYLYRGDNGGLTSLNSVAHTYTSGDVLKLDVTGTTLTVSLNGTTVLIATDATYSGGQPGIMPFYSTDFMDDWSAGPITVTTVTLTAAAGSYTQTGADAPFALHLIAEGAT